MRKFIMLAMAGTLVLAGGLAWAQKTTLKPRRPTPVIQSLSSADSPIPLATPGTISATPATIKFTATTLVAQWRVARVLLWDGASLGA